MASGHPDFVAVGGAGSPAAYAALIAAQLSRTVGLLAAEPLPVNQRDSLTASGIEISLGPAKLRAEHIPWSWLDAEIVLAAPSADEIDSPLLGRFSRSLLGVIGDSGANLSGVGVLFLDEDIDADSVPVTAPIALSTGRNAVLRLWWQGAWHDISSKAQDTRSMQPSALAAVASAFLIRLTETRDAMTAARFAAACAVLLSESGSIGTDTIPTREAITDAEARL